MPRSHPFSRNDIFGRFHPEGCLVKRTIFVAPFSGNSDFDIAFSEAVIAIACGSGYNQAVMPSVPRLLLITDNTQVIFKIEHGGQNSNFDPIPLVHEMTDTIVSPIVHQAGNEDTEFECIEPFEVG